MSWKFGGIYFKKDYSSDIDALFSDIEYECLFAGDSVPLEEVTNSSFMDSAVGIINGSTLLHNNFMPYDCSFEPGKWFEMDKILMNLSGESDILCFFMDGITTSYGLSYFSNKKRVRCRGVFNGKIMINEGSPLPNEWQEDQNEEDRIFKAMEVFTQKPFAKLVLDKNFQLLHYKSATK